MTRSFQRQQPLGQILKDFQAESAKPLPILKFDPAVRNFCRWQQVKIEHAFVAFRHADKDDEVAGSINLASNLPPQRSARQAHASRHYDGHGNSVVDGE